MITRVPSQTDLITARLRTAAPGASIVGGDAAPGVGRIGWNAAVRSPPLAAIACRHADDVSAALRVARDHGASVSVMGGGLDPARRGARPGSLVLDLARMSKAHVDHENREVTVGGGATTGDLLGILPPELVVPTGAVTYTGLVGLISGGGYGPLVSRLGLALDRVTRAELVLADGGRVQASMEENSDLFWALRGGGGGLGVVTSLTFATDRLENLTAAAVSLPLAQALDGLMEVQDLLDWHPDELSIISSFSMPEGDAPRLVLAVCWTGEAGRGSSIVEGLAGRPGAVVLSSGRVPYRSAVAADAQWPFGLHYDGDSRTIARLTRPIAEVLVDAARRMPSKACHLFLHDFHGTASRVPVEATAFQLRQDHFVVGMMIGLDTLDRARVERHRDWFLDASDVLAPFCLPGGYVSFLLPDKADRVLLFYGTAADRLASLRRAVDPSNLFGPNVGQFDLRS